MRKISMFGQAAFIALLAVSATSCTKKCEQTEIKQVVLNDEPLSKVPYDGSESLKFLHVTNDITEDVIFSADGKHSFVVKQPKTEGECPVEYQKESYDINFTTQDQTKTIFFNVLAEPDGSIFSINFNGQLFRDDFSIIGNSQYSGFHPEIEFNGVKFQNVTEMKKLYKNTEVKLFYSPQKGVIRFDFGNNDTWTLQP